VPRGAVPTPEERLASTGDRRQRRWTAPRAIALSVWSLLLIAFWRGTRQADVGAVDSLISAIEGLAAHPWAPAAVLALYLIRPLLLVPITVVNLASGFVLGALSGWALALVGTLASASVGYAIGRLLGSVGLADETMGRWPILRTLRRRGFESVAAGGLMYLHADAVNMPAGLMRIRFRVFLAGIVVGNALTMTAAVLAGASVEGSLADATVSLDATTLWLALGLFAVSMGLAAWLRRRHALGRERPATAADAASSHR
jgi:phospholipase D1/2